MKVKELIEDLKCLPEDADVCIMDEYSNEGLVIDWYSGGCVLRSGIRALSRKKITRIEGLEVGSEKVTIETSDGYVFTMHHKQACCEYVRIEDVNGDAHDLIGEVVRVAEERTNEDHDPPREYDDSHTWTFYTLRTRKGSVDIRWLGESNGYYSERVDVDITKKRAPKSKFIGCEVTID